MRGIYCALVLLVLYGDLLKRVLSPTLSLLALYMIAVLILMAIALRYGPEVPRMSPEGRLVHFAISSLILLYISQLLTSSSSRFMEGLSHAMYMCIPLAYIWVLQKYSKEFNLAAFAQWFFLFMIPINAVGAVQCYVDPDFLISTEYSEQGGIIIRDFLNVGGEKTFTRYPSIFASADRYSAMGLMQLYLVIIVLRYTVRPSRSLNLWLLFNLSSSVAALVIAGARSRILITSASAIAMSAAFIFAAICSRKYRGTRAGFVLTVAVLIVGLLSCFAIGLYIPLEISFEENFPVVTFLMQSVEEDDFSKRIVEAVVMSLMPDQITLFGQGLGTVWEGKPGEFGIWSIWMESGLVWGSLILFAFFLVVIALVSATLKSFFSLSPLNVGIRLTSLLLLTFGLLAGLTSSFELSSGLLLGCVLAVTLRSSENARAKRSAPLKIVSVQH